MQQQPRPREEQENQVDAAAGKGGKLVGGSRDWFGFLIGG